MVSPRLRSQILYAVSGTLLAVLAACGGGDGYGGGGGGGGAATYTVGGMVTGLGGSGLVLQNNGGNDLAVSAAGAFTFTTGLANGTPYTVSVLTQPTNPIQTCVVTNGSGTMGANNVTTVSVACTPTFVAGACGVPQPTGVAAAGPAEGIWGGSFPIFSGVDAIAGHGIVAADGQTHFWVGVGEMWVGSVLASSSGAVASALTRYSRTTSGSAGGLNNQGSPNTAHLVFATATSLTSLTGEYEAPLSDCEPVSLGYNDVYGRTSSLALLAGVYSASDGNGYTLTVTVRTDGQLDGSDTQGCLLLGNVTVPDPAKNYYSAVADATTCGPLNGHYTGVIYLSDSATANDNAGLNLSLSNPGAAIFSTLSR